MTGRFPFLRDLAERAGKTFLQGALATVGLETIAAVQGDPLDLSLWEGIGVTALGGGLAAVLSLGTSLLSKARTGTASASVEVSESTPLASQGPPITRLADTGAGGLTLPRLAPDGYDAKHDRED